MTRFSFWRTDQWGSTNTLQWALSNGVGDYAHVRVNQRFPVFQNSSVRDSSVQFSYVALYAPSCDILQNKQATELEQNSSTPQPSKNRITSESNVNDSTKLTAFT